jgi:hypothetical protein
MFRLFQTTKNDNRTESILIIDTLTLGSLIVHRLEVIPSAHEQQLSCEQECKTAVHVKEVEEDALKVFHFKRIGSQMALSFERFKVMVNARKTFRMTAGGQHSLDLEMCVQSGLDVIVYQTDSKSIQGRSHQKGQRLALPL